MSLALLALPAAHDPLTAPTSLDEALFALMAEAATVHHGQDEPAEPIRSSLVRAALDRSRGLGSAPESALDSTVQQLDDGPDADAALGFASDPRGLYTLDIEILHEDGPSFRQATVIWIDSPLGNRRHAVLENRSGLLPATGLSMGEVAWPDR